MVALAHAISSPDYSQIRLSESTRWTVHGLRCECGAVYHVTEDGWTKVGGDDVGELHYKYYAEANAHPTWGSDPLGTH